MSAAEGIDTSYVSLQREALRVADEQIENLRFQIRLLEETLATSLVAEASHLSTSLSPSSSPPTTSSLRNLSVSSRSTTSFPPAFTSPDTSLRLRGLAEELSRQTARVNPPGSNRHLVEGEEDEKEEEGVRVLERRSQGEGGGEGRGRGRGEVDYNQVRSGSLLEEELVNNRSRPRPPPQESYSIESEHGHGDEFEDDQDHEPGYPFVPEPLEQPLEENEVSPSDVESARLQMEAWRVSEREAWNLEVLEGMYLEKIHRQATLQDGDQAGIRELSTPTSPSSTIRKSRSAKSRSEEVIRERERERERVFELRLVLGMGDGNGDTVRVSSCLKGERPGR